MHSTRRPLHLTAAILGTALGAGLLASAPALADTLVVADATAQNLTSYGSTSAWSRRGDDGTYRLVVMGADGVAADAATRSSSVPFDPDLGPKAGGGRAVVYSRCATGSSRRACDVYLYDVGARTERKVTSVSGRTTSEVGPSYFKGAVAFGRIGSRPGLYVAPAGHGARRIRTGSRYDETDLSESRVVARGHQSGNTFVALAGYKDAGRIVRKGRVDDNEPTVVTSPVLTRYRVFWLQRGPAMDPNARSLAETISTRTATSVFTRADRPFSAGVDAIGIGARNVPQLYSSPAGITRIDPRLTFAP